MRRQRSVTWVPAPSTRALSMSYVVTNAHCSRTLHVPQTGNAFFSRGARECSSFCIAVPDGSDTSDAQILGLWHLQEAPLVPVQACTTGNNCTSAEGPESRAAGTGGYTGNYGTDRKVPNDKLSSRRSSRRRFSPSFAQKTSIAIKRLHAAEAAEAAEAVKAAGASNAASTANAAGAAKGYEATPNSYSGGNSDGNQSFAGQDGNTQAASGTSRKGVRRATRAAKLRDNAQNGSHGSPWIQPSDRYIERGTGQRRRGGRNENGFPGSHMETNLGDSEVVSSLLSRSSSESEECLRGLRSGEITISIAEFNDVLFRLSRLRRIRFALDLILASERQPVAEYIAEARSVKTYTIMIDIFGKAHQLSRAFSLFYGMRQEGVRRNVITFNAMVAACARNNEPDLAYEVFEEMEASGLKPDKFTYGSLIDSCAKCGQVERAFEISRLMDKNRVRKDQTIYSVLMDACGRTQQLDRAFLVFEEMKRNGVWPNLITFSVLIDTCANAREPERAFELFSEIKHWGYAKANVVVYTALIDACSKAGWPRRAELVMMNMLENQVEPNEITYGALIDGWARDGQLDRAFDVLDRMVQEHGVIPNSVLLGGLIEASRRHRDTTRAKKLWETMIEYNIRPSRTYYPALIALAGCNGDVDVAVGIALHSYARGALPRVRLDSDNPTLRGLACAIVYLRQVVDESSDDIRRRQTRQERMSPIYDAVAMSQQQMDDMSPADAFEFCMRDIRGVPSASGRRRSSHNAARDRQSAVGSRRDNNNTATASPAKIAKDQAARDFSSSSR